MQEIDFLEVTDELIPLICQEKYKLWKSLRWPRKDKTQLWRVSVTRILLQNTAVVLFLAAPQHIATSPPQVVVGADINIFQVKKSFFLHNTEVTVCVQTFHLQRE